MTAVPLAPIFDTMACERCASPSSLYIAADLRASSPRYEALCHACAGQLPYTERTIAFSYGQSEWLFDLAYVLCVHPHVTPGALGDILIRARTRP